MRRVRELARLLRGRSGCRESLPLSDLLAGDPGPGPGMIDRQTHHTTLPVLIARVENGAFRVIDQRPPVAGDPYLTRPRASVPGLRVVS